MLKVKGMKVQYDQQIILQESDLVFPNGTLSAIIGENGSGKTSHFCKDSLKIRLTSSCFVNPYLGNLSAMVN